MENKELMQHFTMEELEGLFNHDIIFKNVDYIFERCGL
jgi:hypothetical protein